MEYETMRRWNEELYECLRTAGSHGKFDVIAIRTDRKPEFIQCKVVGSDKEARRIMEKFEKETIPSSFYHQSIEVKIKRTSDILRLTV